MYGSSDSCPSVRGRLTIKDNIYQLILTNRKGESRATEISGRHSDVHQILKTIPNFLERDFGCCVEVEGFLSDNKILACSTTLLSDNNNNSNLICRLSWINDDVAQWIIDSQS